MDRQSESDRPPTQGKLFSQGSPAVSRSEPAQPTGDVDTVQTAAYLATNDDTGVVVTNNNTTTHRDIKSIIADYKKLVNPIDSLINVG